MGPRPSSEELGSEGLSVGPMNVAFGAPALLAGAALVSVPILIHLLNRRRFVIQPFAAMRFLQVNEGFDSFQSVWQSEPGLLPEGFYYDAFALPEIEPSLLIFPSRPH